MLAWLHTLSPFAVRLGVDWGIRWYGVSYAAAFLVGWFVLRALSRRGLVLIPPERVGDAILYAVVGVVVGGRLGYVLFYQPSLLWTFDPDVPWWGVLQINKGGMASHGGMIGVIIAAWFIGRGWKDEQGVRHGAAPMLHVLDVMALLAPFGLFLGRLANFVNGELLGRVVSPPGMSAPWWSVKFPQEIAGGYPSQLDSVGQADLERLVGESQLPGETFDEGFRHLLRRIQSGGQEAHALGTRLEPFISARHPSQLYQAAAEGIVVGTVVWLVARRARRSGIVGCWFLISYGVLRVITEVWRLPDANLVHQRIAGLSRGQWFSVAMVAIGLFFLWHLGRREGPRLLGWGEPTNGPARGAPSTADREP